VAAHVLSPETGAVLVVVVTLSMVATPLLLLLHDKFVAPRFQGEKKRRPDDQIEAQDNPIVIAGFGRFGQIIGRLLAANKIGVTVLDHDPEQIDLLRKFGFKVFYGDATRVDLLVAAGIEKAKALVIAIDNVDDSLALVDAVRLRLPQLTILARARNVTHYYELMKRGVTLIERETFESALLLGEQTLLQVGYPAERARRAAAIFRAHNLKTLLAVAPHFQDQQKVLSIAHQAREELEDMFEGDAAAYAAEEADKVGATTPVAGE